MKRLIIIGSSTGGLKTLKELFKGMGKVESAILLIQHHPPYITRQLLSVFEENTSLRAQIVQSSTQMQAGRLYVAPGGYHAIFKNYGHLDLEKSPKVNFVRPSIDVAMNSLQRTTAECVLGIIMTGMGQDGSQGIRHVKGLNGTTCAQAPESCVISSMPCKAIETGCIDHVLPVKGIRDLILSFSQS